MPPAPFEELLAALEARGYDGEEENLRCLVSVEREEAAYYRQALLRLGSQEPEAQALSGKLLLNLGRTGEALSRLEPLRGRPCRLPASVWLAEALLLSGRSADALPLLDEALGRPAPHPWALFYRGAARLSLGDAAGARADAARLLKTGPAAAGHALSAVLHGAAKDFKRARAETARAAALSPGLAWPALLDYSLCLAAGDAPGAQAVLKGLIARRPSASAHARLARLQESLGLMPQALASAQAALELESSAELHALKGALHHRWREYALSAEAFERAGRLEPGQAEWPFQSGRAWMAAGELDKALAETRRARALAPGASNIALREAQLLALCGLQDQARAAAERLAGPDLKAFGLGYAALRAGDWKVGRAELERCAKLAGEGALGLKARFYATVAGVLLRRPPEAPSEQLLMVGLGVNPPYSASAEAIWAVSRCDAIFNNVTGDELAELLLLLCPSYRPVAYHNEADEPAIAERMLESAAPGRTLGFVTRGSAIIQGPLALELKNRCGERGLSWRSLAAVSSAEFFEAAHGHLGGGPAGLVQCDSKGLGPKTVLDPALPLTLFWSFEAAGRGDPYQARLARRLARAYGPDRTCVVLDHQIGQAPKRLKLKELGSSALGRSALLYIPGGKGA